jgi:peptidoglycan/LPS O-acetylase OafA/YrhL
LVCVGPCWLVSDTGSKLLALPAEAWLVILFSCFLHSHGYANAFLSAPIFEPMSRLTFCAFLIHPMVITVFYFSSTQYFRFSSLTIICWFASHLGITYLFAAALYLTIERPICNLENLTYQTASRWWSYRKEKELDELDSGIDVNETPKKNPILWGGEASIQDF